MNKDRQLFALLSSILIIVEICIATYIQGGFVRTVLGDFLIAILLYCLVRSFFTQLPIKTVAIGVLLFTFFVEFSQWIDIVELLGIPKNYYSNLLFGNAFDWKDMIAYTIGIAAIYIFDLKWQELKKVKY